MHESMHPLADRPVATLNNKIPRLFFRIISLFLKVISLFLKISGLGILHE